MSQRSSSLLGGMAAATALVCVGSSVAVSALLVDAPFLTAQALRYAAACAALFTLARLLSVKIHLPHGTQWLWLTAVAALGLALFNVALIVGSTSAEPAVFGVAVACVPIVLALIGPLIEGRRLASQTIVAAVVVTAGAVLVTGAGRADAVGVVWATVVLACEAGFTLLALPVLPRLGAWGVSVWSTGIAAVVLAAVGIVLEGPTAITELTATDLAASAYLAVVVTAIAFLLWYFGVRTLGAATAGLFTGVAPVAAAMTGILLGAPAPRFLVWLGIGVIAAGLLIGLRADRSRPRKTAGPREQ